MSNTGPTAHDLQSRNLVFCSGILTFLVSGPVVQMSTTLDFQCNVISSSLSGFLSRMLFHPIDTAKSRIQASVHNYKNTHAALVGTMKQSGVKGLYRGLGAALIGGIPGTCMYLTGYEICKSYMVEWNFSPFLAFICSGMFAEVFCCTVFVPVDVIKERLQVYQPPLASASKAAVTSAASSSSAGSSSCSVTYTGSIDAFKKILRHEGMRGLYKGYFATIFSFGPYSSIFFLGNEKIKEFILTSKGTSNTSKEVSFAESLFISATAAAIASFCTTPLDLVKLRMQINDRQLNLGYFMQMMKNIYIKEGMRGLFRGSGARVLYFTPSNALTMALYTEINKPVQKYLSSAQECT